MIDNNMQVPASNGSKHKTTNQLPAAATAATRCKSRAHSSAPILKHMLPLLLAIRFASSSLAQHQHHDSTGNLTTSPVWLTNHPLLVAPSTSEYLELYRYACANYTPRVTRQEVIAHYRAVPGQRLRRMVAKWNPSRECRREETAWRYQYFDEVDQVLVRERSIDQRAANVLYLSRQINPLSIDFFTYNWGDPQADLDNMRRVAGPQVDDQRCGRELRQMLDLVADLTQRVDAIRQSPGSNDDDKEGNSSTQVLTDSHLSLAKILDSYGRYDSGLLFGKVFAPGSYHQCIWNKLILAPEHKLGMRFCWAHLSTRKHLDVSLRKRERTRFETNVDVLLSGICIPESCHSKSFPSYQREFQELINSQFKLPRSMYVDEHMEVSSVYCLVDEGSEFTIPLAGKLLIGFLVSWSLMVVAASLWNISRRHSRGRATPGGPRRPVKETLLDHLDIGNSWHDFMNEYIDRSKLRGVQLDTLNVIKVFGCAFVVLGHTMALYLAHSMDNVRTTKYIESQPAITLILAGTMMVDTFFVITGILWSYFMLKRINKRAPAPLIPRESGADLSSNNLNCKLNNNLASAQVTTTTCFVDHPKQVVVAAADENIPMAELSELDDERAASGSAHLSQQKQKQRKAQLTHKSLHARARFFFTTWFQYSSIRYLKIVPLYVMVHWFKKYVFIYAGTGPFWDHGLNQLTTSGTCHKETPLTPFTFLAAYYPLSRQCIFQSWSVANDIFFALLAPPVILFMNVRPRLAAGLSIISCLVILAFAQYGLAHVPSFVDEEIRELNSYGFYRFFDEISHFYTAPHYRIFCFLAGVWAGYFVYVYQADLDKRRDRMSGQASSRLLLAPIGQLQGKQEVGATVPGTPACLQCIASPRPQRRNGNSRPGVVETGGYDFEEPQQVVAHKFEQLPQSEGEAPCEAATRIEWPSWLRGPATWFAIGYILLIPPIFAYNDMLKIYLDPIYRYTYAQFLSTMRIVWAAANAIMFVRMMTDWKDTVLMRLQASRFWQIFAKLNYAMLLVHLDMVNYTIESSPSLPDNFTKWAFFNLGAGVYLACIPLSIYVHIVFESPINRLIRSWLPSR